MDNVLLIFILLGAFIGIVFILLGLIRLIQKKEVKKIFLTALCCFGVAIVSFILFGVLTDSDTNKKATSNISTSSLSEQEIESKNQEQPTNAQDKKEQKRKEKEEKEQERIELERLEQERKEQEQKEQERIELEQKAQEKKRALEEYEDISYKALLREPDKYIGKYISIKVQISQILNVGLFDDETYYFGFTDNDGYELYFDDKYGFIDSRIDDDMKILENDIIQVYGKFSGLKTFQNALTHTDSEIPIIEMIVIELISE